MYDLNEAGRVSMASLLRYIIQNNPSIITLNLELFSYDRDRVENIGELVLETLLNSNIDSITDLNLRQNPSWFKNYNTK